MDGVNNLRGILIFSLMNNAFLIILVLVLLIQLPFRLFKIISNLFSSRPIRRRIPPVKILPSDSLFPSFRPSSTIDSSIPEKDTIVLIHGYPDAPPIWKDTVKELTSLGYKCLLISLPGSTGEAVDQNPSPISIVDQIDSLISQSTSSKSSVTIIAHDWGSGFAQWLYKWHFNRVHRLVLLDVGDFSNVHWIVKYAILSYQLCLTAIYCIGNPLGSKFLQFNAKISNYSARPIKELDSDMAWPYPSFMRALIQNNNGLTLDLDRKKLTSIRNNRSSVNMECPNGNDVPKLFFYGNQKPFYFQSEAFLNMIRDSKEGAVHGLDCGHWLQLEAKDQYLSILTDWLHKTDSYIPDN